MVTSDLQVDADCTWGVLVDDNFFDSLGAAQGKSKDEVRRELADLFLTFNNDVYQHVPAGLTVNTHVCRGTSILLGFIRWLCWHKELLGEEAVNAYF